ncbi:MAG: hypothetical protein QOI89_2608 [Solirubrobacteraceae bacterium]|jgi:plastocyanin|nr:hypothetical protein [Solirubrobacteraceae bacterium]
MRLRRIIGVLAAASLAMVVGLPAAGSAARGLVAPVSAGPPQPLPVKHLDLNGFFPGTTQIHVGDSVRFSINGFHTVTFLAAGQKLPAPIIPGAGTLVSGQLDAAGAPFWFNGQPKQIINPTAALPSGSRRYNGSGFLNSGLPVPSLPPAPFVVKFTKAGKFSFNCIVHPGMRGTVRVLPKRKHVPSAARDRLAAAEQAESAVAAATALAKVKPPTATVFAGNDSGAVTWLRFFPENLKVKVGTPVEFKLVSRREIHTVTIGPAAYTTAIESSFTTPELNLNGPPTLVVNPRGAYPSDPPPLPAFNGANHGNGFEGTGILAGGGPLPSSARITFTKPGVYRYECVVHSEMDGKITVTK